MTAAAARHAPAVRYPLQRSTTLAWAVAMLLGAGATVLAATFLAVPQAISLPRALVAGGLWCAAALAACHFCRTQYQGALHWDGRFWLLEGATPGDARHQLEAPPQLVLDLQSHLWLCVVPVGRRRLWVWAERRTQPERWRDLRRAVYSRAGPRPGAADADTTTPASGGSRGA